jgi:segregation and condensation protein B
MTGGQRGVEAGTASVPLAEGQASGGDGSREAPAESRPDHPDADGAQASGLPMVTPTDPEDGAPNEAAPALDDGVEIAQAAAVVTGTDGAAQLDDAPGAEPAGGADQGADEAPDAMLLAEGARIAEALIFASDRPVTPAMLGAVLPQGLAPGAAVAALVAACEGRGVTIVEVAGGWAFRTAPDLAQRLTKVVQAPRRLPRAAMEALSIIAYHQPCTRGEIEEIRGAALAQTTLEALLELGLVAPRGRREVPGRPTLWGTTPKFLEQFGLKALSDLPRKEELVTAETGPALPLGRPEPAAAVVATQEAGAAPEDESAVEADATGNDSQAGAAP